MTKTDADLLNLFEGLACTAGRAIRHHFEAGCAVESKADQSPVTEADHEAERIILTGLRSAFPEIPVVAEEEAAAGVVPMVGERYFLVDPLDGTREFVSGSPDFTVNIALIRKGVPVVGAVLAPARGLLYAGGGEGAQKVTLDDDMMPARREPIGCVMRSGPPRIVASRSHRTPETDAYIARHDAAEIVSVGSSLKFCMLAEGSADLYPRFGPTMQWDIAAGGYTATTDGQVLTYGPREGAPARRFASPWFIASAGAQIAASA